MCIRDRIVFYKPLTKDNVTHIIDLMAADLNRRLEDKQLTVVLTPAAKEEIIASAYDPIYGARPLRRYLQHTVETLITVSYTHLDVYKRQILILAVKFIEC